MCRGVPRGPHNPFGQLGMQGIGLEGKQNQVGTSKEGLGGKARTRGLEPKIQISKLAPTSNSNLELMESFIKGKKGSTILRRKRSKLWGCIQPRSRPHSSTFHLIPKIPLSLPSPSPFRITSLHNHKNIFLTTHHPHLPTHHPTNNLLNP